MIKKLNLFLFLIIFYFFSQNFSFANIQVKIINNLQQTDTLSFDFIQKIGDRDEIGNCYIKFSYLIKCIYTDEKEKIIISNGRTLAVVKKKYKKVYLYPIKKTPLFTILDKRKILDLVKNNNPIKINKNIIQFLYIGKNDEKLKIFFDRNTFNIAGWETKDSYSNTVIFDIFNVEKNIPMNKKFFKIPRVEDL